MLLSRAGPPCIFRAHGKALGCKVLTAFIMKASLGIGSVEQVVKTGRTSTTAGELVSWRQKNIAKAKIEAHKHSRASEGTIMCLDVVRGKHGLGEHDSTQ